MYDTNDTYIVHRHWRLVIIHYCPYNVHMHYTDIYIYIKTHDSESRGQEAAVRDE